MKSGRRCGACTHKTEIDYPCDQCAKDGGSFRELKAVEFAGFVFDESNDDYIDMIIESAVLSPGLKRRRPIMFVEREFEFDISSSDAHASKELESIVSPADELFYKGKLLPLDLNLRTEMIEKFEKLLSSETKPSSNCSADRDELGFPASHKSCYVTPFTVGKETCSKRFATALDRNQSTHWQQAAVADKLKSSKAYIKTLLSKASTARRANNDHSQNTIQRVSCDHPEDATAAIRSISRENSFASNRKSFSTRFSSLKESPLIPKPYSKPFSSSNRVISTHSGAFLRRSISSMKGLSTPLTSDSINSKPFNLSNTNASQTHSGVLLKRSMSSASSGIENGIQGAIAHCKQSNAAYPLNMIDTAGKYMQGTTSNQEVYADDLAQGRPRSVSRIATCDPAARSRLVKRVFMR